MTSKRFDKGHRDANEPLITEILNRFHVPYRKGSDADGYDLLVMTSPMMLIEVKNPENKQASITDTENETQEYCINNGIAYYIVYTPERMAEILERHQAEHKTRR
jgi:Uma2 family endonuclease